MLRLGRIVEFISILFSEIFTYLSKLVPFSKFTSSNEFIFPWLGLSMTKLVILERSGTCKKFVVLPVKFVLFICTIFIRIMSEFILFRVSFIVTFM